MSISNLIKKKLSTFEGFVKSILLRYAEMGSCQYLCVAIVAISAGVFIPLWLYTRVFNRFPVTRFMFGLQKSVDKSTRKLA